MWYGEEEVEDEVEELVDIAVVISRKDKNV